MLRRHANKLSSEYSRLYNVEQRRHRWNIFGTSTDICPIQRMSTASFLPFHQLPGTKNYRTVLQFESLILPPTHHHQLPLRACSTGQWFLYERSHHTVSLLQEGFETTSFQVEKLLLVLMMGVETMLEHNYRLMMSVADPSRFHCTGLFKKKL